jgi:adenosyl cobinamide kinase/adenosyl cobinamide phosphate guanylyltransferase
VGMVLLDSLGPWVAGHGEGEPVDGAALCRALAERNGDTVIVSEEVGLGVHPPTAAGRQFRDALGTLNQAVAEAADAAYLIVAGRALRLDQAP